MTGELYPEAPPTQLARTRFDELVRRREAGEPLQYVLGRWGFRSLDLMVDRRVLIPRPETEQVVEVALAELDALKARRLRRQPPGATGPFRVVDLGTGSGAIALSIAAERPAVEVWATDVSKDALDVAAANLAGLGGFAATRVRLIHGDWWAALPDALRHGVDLVVSNPPYIATNEMTDVDHVVRAWEPESAVHAGPRGVEAIERILHVGRSEWLRPDGAAVIEIAPHQAGPATDLARQAGFGHAEVRPDLSGRDRVLVAHATPPDRAATTSPA